MAAVRPYGMLIAMMTAEKSLFSISFSFKQLADISQAINVTISNLVRWTRISVFNFLSIAKLQKYVRIQFMGRSRKQQSALSQPHVLTHSERHSSCRHPVRDSSVLIRGRSRPSSCPPPPLSLPHRPTSTPVFQGT